MKTLIPHLRGKVLAVTLAIAAVSAPAVAQNAALGNIAGVVHDASGAVVAGATVTVTNTGTGAKRTLSTDSDGHYTATFLQPGNYEVVITGPGFGTIDQKNVSVQVGGINTVDRLAPRRRCHH